MATAEGFAQAREAGVKPNGRILDKPTDGLDDGAQKEDRDRISAANYNKALLHANIWQSMFLGAQSYVSSALVTINMQGRMLHLNNPARMLLEVAEKDTSSISILRFMRNDDLTTRIFAGNTINDYNTSIITPSGQKQCLVSTRPVVDGAGGALQGCIIRMVELEPSDAEMRNPLEEPLRTFDTIIGNETAMRDVKRKALLFSTDRTSIIITGNVGTGKDTFARAIHHQRYSGSPDAPFVSVNCAALSTSAVQTKLFGLEDGTKVLPGKFETAHSGTLYLDNIDDLAMDLQPLFLRVLDEHAIVRTGGAARVPTQFKLICSSSRNIMDLVNEGRFRPDLYYRISDVILHLPPLRERPADISALSAALITQYCNGHGIPPISISEKALRTLRNHSWPGNVRELTSAITYACHTCTRGEITVDNLPSDIRPSSAVSRSQSDNSDVIPLAEIERAQIIATLQETGGNATEAARLLGMGRSTLYKRLKLYGISAKR